MPSTHSTSIGKKILLFSLCALVLVTASAGSYPSKTQSVSPSSLSEILVFYGFKTPAQKEALEFLMKKSGILKSTDSFTTLFPNRTHTTLLFQDLLKFVQLTQKYFTIRTGTQERWEVQPTEWMKQNQTEILRKLDTLGITNTIAPSFSNPDVLCILGSTHSFIVSRLGYAGKLYNEKTLQAKYLVLLSGERKVTIGVDGTEAELSALAKKYRVNLAALTEAHLMQESYTTSSLFSKLPTDVINTPAGDLPRPTTETTLKEFCKWLKNHPDVKSVSFVSDQPHVKYQQAVIGEVLRQQGQTIQFEVIGSAISPGMKIQELVGAVGSHIWAETPNILYKTKLTTTDPESRKAFLELYSKQPLIYKNVESLLNTNKNSRSESSQIQTYQNQSSYQQGFQTPISFSVFIRINPIAAISNIILNQNRLQRYWNLTGSIFL